MIPFLSGQAGVFLWAMAIGIAAAFFYDFYGALSTGMRLTRWRAGVGDAVFWAALTALVFLLLLMGNAGEVRWYVLAGIALGYLLYRRLAGRKGFLFWRRVLAGGGRAGRFAARPFLSFGRILLWPVRRLTAFFQRGSPPSSLPPTDQGP